MAFASLSQFHVYLPWLNTWFEKCLNSVLNVKALIGTFNQEKALGEGRALLLRDCEIFANLRLKL